MVGRIYYKTIRDYLPRKIGILNGYPARARRLFDAKDIIPDYEAELVQAIKKTVKPEDMVIIVGGGYGISSVVAAEKAGPNGSVIIYEPDPERYEIVHETLKINDVDGELNQMFIGKPIDLNPQSGTDNLQPSQLPECDVVVMDCEGSEVDVISRMEICPQRIIVETHGCFRKPTEETVDALESKSYTINNIEEDQPELGIDIVTAKISRRDSN
jgi:tRNA A58 N-methylase Trm61